MSRRGEKIEAAHMEQVKELDIGQRSEHGSEQKEVIKAKVLSVALTDAVAKDNISKWSVNMLKLYGIMLLVTLSTLNHPQTSSRRKLRFNKTIA